MDTAKLKLFTYDLFNWDEIPLKLVRAGNNEDQALSFEVQKSSFGGLKFEDTYYPLFIEAGYDLHISMEAAEGSSTISFSGEGALANNYLVGTTAIVNRFYQTNGEFWRSERHVAEEALLNLQGELKQFHQSYTDTSQLEAEILTFFEQRNSLTLIDLIQQYSVVNQIPYATKDSVEDIFNQTSANIPMDKKYLDAGMIEYARVLELYVRSEIHPLLLEGREASEIEAVQESFPKNANQLIKAKELPEEIESFLLANDIGHWLALQGLTPSIDSLYKEFMMLYPTSTYGVGLTKNYDEWLSISSGQPARQIRGLSLAGDTLSLDDFKGKLVYIDVWASWCLPCVAEFAHYEKLHNEFGENSGLEFLFVSIDKEEKEWKNFMQTKSPPAGIHINDLRGDDSYEGIFKAYKMWGIPRYIIIDQAGKIVDANAPPPSSEKMIDILQALI